MLAASPAPPPPTLSSVSAAAGLHLGLPTLHCSLAIFMFPYFFLALFSHEVKLFGISLVLWVLLLRLVRWDQSGTHHRTDYSLDRKLGNVRAHLIFLPPLRDPCPLWPLVQVLKTIPGYILLGFRLL